MDSGEIMAKKQYNLILKKGMAIGDQYVLTEYISEGSYGYVWQAVRRHDGMVVALKIPKNQEKGDAALAEGEKLVQIHHPNVINIFWMGRVAGIFVIEMEYFKGYPLSKELTDKGFSRPRTMEKVFRLFEGILDGVIFMHSKKISHGDLKPDNILINDADIKITDFGSSRLIEDIFVKTVDGAGTWAYIAPEVVGSKKRGLNSDIYSLGVILYQLLTGRTPHDNLLQVLHNVPYPRPSELNSSVSPHLEEVILKALEREPENRFQKVSEFKEIFHQVIKNESTDYLVEKIIPKSIYRKTKDAFERAILNCKLKKFSLAEQILKEEIAGGNNLPDLSLQLAYVFYQKGRLFEAMDVIQKIDLSVVAANRQAGVKDNYYYLKAQILFSMKKYEESLEAFEKLHQLSPDNVDYSYRLAVCYGICGYEDKAIMLLEKINATTPGIWVVVKKLGFAYDQKQNFAKARAYFRYALRLRPQDTDVQKKLEAYDFYL
jgi:serine/threonine protein kinase